MDSELPANQKFIHFTPTSLSLTQLKKYTLKNSNAHLATFDDIRSTFTFKHNSILIFTDYILLFSTPNLVTILAE